MCVFYNTCHFYYVMMIVIHNHCSCKSMDGIKLGFPKLFKLFDMRYFLHVASSRLFSVPLGASFVSAHLSCVRALPSGAVDRGLDQIKDS